MFKRSQLFKSEPTWLRTQKGGLTAAPSSVRSWLYEAGSLTARLRSAVGAEFGVRLLRQAWDRPFASEARALGLALHGHALVREVLLHSGGQPLVLARTVIPRQALSGAQRRLAHLGDRPLGELLFTFRGLSRKCLELARVEPWDWRAPIAEEIGVDAVIWGRRSLYAVAQDRLLVCEFFLPAVLTLPEGRT